MNNTNQQISNIMESRRERQNSLSMGQLPNNMGQLPNNMGIPTDNEMRNDNDLDLVERNQMMENDSFSATFDPEYYLDSSRTTKRAYTDEVAVMNANGGMNETLQDKRKLSNSELLKNKALELETHIVERITLDKIADARRVFSVLEKMHRKYDDQNVSDIYYRVLQSLPKEDPSKVEIYSYGRDKNNFKEVLSELGNNINDIKAYNEGNPCIDTLSSMWEECDINICSDKCKRKILEAKNTSNNEECKKLECGHIFHSDCIDNWLKRTLECPMCRNIIT